MHVWLWVFETATCSQHSNNNVMRDHDMCSVYQLAEDDVGRYNLCAAALYNALGLAVVHRQPPTMDSSHALLTRAVGSASASGRYAKRLRGTLGNQRHHARTALTTGWTGTSSASELTAQRSHPRAQQLLRPTRSPPRSITSGPGSTIGPARRPTSRRLSCVIVLASRATNHNGMRPQPQHCEPVARPCRRLLINELAVMRGPRRRWKRT